MLEVSKVPEFIEASLGEIKESIASLLTGSAGNVSIYTLWFPCQDNPCTVAMYTLQLFPTRPSYGLHSLGCAHSCLSAA
jgi:hypothetical protein